MVLKQLNWKQGKTCAIVVYKPWSQYRERVMSEVVYQGDRGGNGEGCLQSRCMNHERCRIRGSSYSRYVRKEELRVQVVNWKQFNPDEMLNNQESFN